MNASQNIYDITFIGSGISTSYSVLNILDLVKNETNTESPISISIIEKYSEFNVGLPYGSRSGFTTLLITSLKNFLIEPELNLFIEWLNKNKLWLLKTFENEGGVLSKKWLNDNKEAIKNNQWEDLFIPRHFFGCYVNSKLKKEIEKLTKKGLIKVDFMQAEVIDVDKVGGAYCVYFENQLNTIKTKKVVLSTGSLPVRHLWIDNPIIEDKNLLFINNPYAPELLVTLDKIFNFVKTRADKTTNVLIVGSNASALEMLYKINDILGYENNINFTFLSNRGNLPDAVIDVQRRDEFVPEYLNNLKSEKTLTAKAIAEATFKDLDYADSINLGQASTVDIISSYFGVLLERLDDNELRFFACNYGNAIGKRQRCAGLHYMDVITHLEKQNRFNHIAGGFKDFNKNNNDEAYYLNYENIVTKKQATHLTPFHLVINCIGSITLESNNIPTIHRNLISKGYCVPNESKIGFRVNNSLEATKDLYIMGPMLAGNVIENKAVWHVEHCGRIIWLSKIISKMLIENLILNKNTSKNSYQLEIHSLNTSANIEAYKSLLKENWNNNIYYTYDHLKYFESETDSLIYFLFKINNVKAILMPIILRRITTDIDGKALFDAITPYGYSGPLYDEAITADNLKAFWAAVDDWYSKNNVITEFIRFSLNNNYTGYSGLLVHSLYNIKGALPDNFETQWDSFLPKVRNNYRKALSYNLTSEIYNGPDINKQIITSFFNIYTKTMQRLNAKAIYFFSLDYFESLILNQPNKFSIALVYFNDIAISTELIIKNEDNLYAFLGGTDSDFFNYRPNDFLRVEVIKWAIENKFKYYVLGGGLVDGDGLYKSKKCLFPKDDDVVYYTGRKIINQQLYHILCENNVADYQNIHKEELKNYFFPLYRFNNR